MRVLVIADNVLARTGLAALMAAQEDLTVVGQISSGDNLNHDLDVYRADIAIFDLGHDPVHSVPRLALLEGVPLVVLLPDAELFDMVLAVMSESYGVLLRDSSPRLMTAALHAVYYGLVVLDPLLASGLAIADVQDVETLQEDLTPRESQVLQLLAEGLPNKMIAQRLSISPNTVKFHINAILSKLSVQSRTEAVVRATRLGLVML